MSDNWFAINFVGNIKIKGDVIGKYLIVLNFADSDWISFLNWNLESDFLEKFLSIKIISYPMS
jgi:hypothetical protein